MQIDVDSVIEMSDTQLRDMGLKYGDVIALRVFVRTRLQQSADASLPSVASSSEHRRSSLLQRIRERLGEQRSKRGRMSSNKNAKKPQRKVELGWLHYDEKSAKFVQVRPCKGGGIRHVVVSTSARPQDILVSAKQLFFPSGVSSKGHIDNFEVKLVNVEHAEVSASDNIGILYSQTCVPLLRLYLTTRQAKVGVCKLCQLLSL